MSVEKKKYPSALPTNWPARDEQPRKTTSQLSSTGKVDVYYYRYRTRLLNSLVLTYIVNHSILSQSRREKRRFSRTAYQANSIDIQAASNYLQNTRRKSERHQTR